MKSGANVKDIVKIKAMAGDGLNVEDISSALNIKESVVESFIKYKPSGKSKKKGVDAAPGFGSDTF